MAKYNIPFDIAIEYDSQQLTHMKFQDLQRVAASLARESRSRVKELQAMEVEHGKSPALASYERFRDSTYSARYKGRDALMEEIREMKNFLDNETSTKKGYEDMINEFNEQLGFETSKEFRSNFYNNYEKWKETNDIKESHEGSLPYYEAFIEEVAKFGNYTEVDFDKIMVSMNERFNI